MEKEKQKQDIKSIEKDAEGPWWRESVIVFWHLSSWIIGPVIIAVLLGEWLQNKYDIEDWVYLAIISLAFLASVYGLIMEGKKAVKNMESMEIKEKEENKEKNNKIIINPQDEDSWRKYLDQGK